ncbi:MAG TPA: cyclopropane-fatty-acyl-phospholipid synthase family protein, partial [Acidimicrobiales bacterium]|nr:cyclopropane-fatty-acyl-phospholipid synthase family protein [Acidimicrobiales bacterium]
AQYRELRGWTGMDGAAHVVGRLVEAFLGPAPPVGVRCWDGTSWGDRAAPLQVHVNTPVALRRLLWDPGELGLARAHVAGELDFDGSVFDLLALRDRVLARDADAALHLRPREWAGLVRAARRLGVLGRRPVPPPEEARLSGRRHSKRRDRAAISHHYDVGNDFYELVLGPSMTYSCALFPHARTTLEEAQALKHEHVCRKLGLAPGQRLLDIGCGWGGMVLHAARHHGVRAVGITISEQQAYRAQQRVRAAGLADRVEIRLQDYREVADAPFDAVSSIGMFEHVGMTQVQAYFGQVRSLLRPGGRFLNHAISRPSGEGPLDRDSFPARYVFPDGELHEVGRTVSAMQDLGFECRDVESLREHYARTLRCWVTNLERHWGRVVALVGPARARVWRLYLAGSAVGFESNRLNIHQVLAVHAAADGASGMPAVRPATATSVEDALASR